MASGAAAGSHLGVSYLYSNFPGKERAIPQHHSKKTKTYIDDGRILVAACQSQHTKYLETSHMKKFALSAVVLGVIAVCQPVLADDLSDLKAEIAAQKQAAAKQQDRLDALERKLESATAQQAAAKAPAVAAAPATDGLTFKSPNQSVSLYGLIDVTLSSVNHKNAAGDSLNGFQTPWFSGSRWGMTGSRDLSAGGLKAIFRLESEFVPATGEEDTPGVLFNRDAWAGFQSEDLGKLTFGRQNALGRDFSAGYGDTYGSAKASTEEGGYTNTNNFKQMVYYGGSANGTRINNGIVWKKAFSNGLVAGAAYSFGGVVGDSSEGTTMSAALAYNAGAFNLAGFVTQAKINGLTDNASSIGGNYTVGEFRINAGYFRYTAEQGSLGNRTDNAYTLSAKFAPAGKMDYELGYQVMKADNAALSKPSGGIVKNAFASIAGLTTVGSGSRNTLYASTFYHFDKSTEIYLAADYLTLDSGYGTVNGASSQTEVGVGVRTRF
jgi:predicted porin